LTFEQVADAEYESPTPAEGIIRLSDGTYRHEIAAGAASDLSVTLVPELLTFGDLDSDGVADAAAILAGSGGGSGTFISLAALLDEDGSPGRAATAYLGDRVQVTSVTIEAGEIIVSLISHRSTDPLCCPTQPATRRFRLDRGSLVESAPASSQP
jgi:hypothetical protein